MRREWLEKDYYTDLVVAKSASAKDIKRAYRKLAQQYHPDTTSGDPASETRFKTVNEAYSVLSDDKTRAEYDQARDAFARGAYAGGPPGGATQYVTVDDLGDVLNRRGLSPLHLQWQRPLTIIGVLDGDGLACFGPGLIDGAKLERIGADGQFRPIELDVEIAVAQQAERRGTQGQGREPAIVENVGRGVNAIGRPDAAENIDESRGVADMPKTLMKPVPHVDRRSVHNRRSRRMTGSVVHRR